VCANLSSDTDNCGHCGGICPAGQQCNGACACPTATPNACGVGTAAFCTTFQSDGKNCGGCGNGCAAGQVCTNGSCTESCPAPLVICSNTCADTRFDPSNCGGCGDLCSLPNVASDGCISGACSVGACNSGYANCNGVAGDGCEIDTVTDPNNCGGCNIVCPGGTICDTGSCVTSTIECSETANESQSISLNCPPGLVIRQITFASYGTPNGSCGAFTLGGCNNSDSVPITSSFCLNQSSCSFPSNNATFGDPCEFTGKHMYVQVACAP